MTKKSPNQIGGIEDMSLDDDQTVVPVTQTDSEESQITSKEGCLFGFVEESQDFLLVVPLRSSDLKADLTSMNAPSRQLFDLIFGDIVIQQDHAADGRLVTISFTTPRRSRETASRTASGEMRHRYSAAIASGV
jgi:hypothetical protein